MDTRTKNPSTFLEASEYQQQTVYMNATSEYQLEAGCMTSILSTRAKLKIDFWNVRTMYETGKQAEVIREMMNNILHLLRISECRWTDFGKNTTNKVEAILYLGSRDCRLHKGVAIIRSKVAARS